MGGRSWWYLTEYDENAATALRALRSRVFVEGEYFFDGPRLENIDALLDAAGERGTSSILDIEGVAADADAGIAVRASRLVLEAAFGTATPNLAQVRREALTLAGLLPRWRCVYFPVFQDGQKVKLCFAGNSGESSEAQLDLSRARDAELSLRNTFRPTRPLETRVARPVASY